MRLQLGSGNNNGNTAPNSSELIDMYISDNHKSPAQQPPPPPPPPIDFYNKDPGPLAHHHHHHHHSHPVASSVSVDRDVDDADRDMMIEVVSAAAAAAADHSLSTHHHHHPHAHHHPQQTQHAQMVIGDAGSGGEDPELNNGHLGCGNRPSASSTSAAAPKKRAETWVQEETRSLIGLRREMDSLFNTSKSNKHLWEQISSKMREKGFDRSPTMCTDKWRNLLKEFKKVKQQNGVNGSAKMSYYKEIEEILRERSRSGGSSAANSSAAVAQYKSPSAGNGSITAGDAAKVDAFIQFDKGIQDAGIPFGPIEANDRQALNLERRLDHEGHSLAMTAADAVGDGGVPPSFWREAPGSGDERHSYVGRVILVKWGDYTRRIGIDGTAEAISHAIKSTFGIRTKRAFWLEDEDQIVRSFDRDMPLGNYTLHLDEGITIKVCHYDESDHLPVHTEEKTFYGEEDFRDFFNRHGWSALRELHGYRNIDNLDDLRPDALYRGVT